jgi:hypothetical protein
VRDAIGRLGLHRLSPRDRRALRLGLMIAVPVVLWAGVVRPWRRTRTELQDRLETERGLLVREQALLENAATLPDALREADMQAELARRRMVAEPSPALAEAALTTELERLATDSRVLLEEMKSIEPPRTASPPAGLQAIRLAMSGQSDLNGFSTFLQRIEEDGLLMRVVELSIQPVMERPSSNGRGRGQSQQPAGPARPTGVVEFAVMVEAYAASDAFADGAAPQETGT